ncbi:MAG: RDD family protein [Chloroflexi bacterium]|nr:RDD family protein [Chloroflexota bacterium]
MMPEIKYFLRRIFAFILDAVILFLGVVITQAAMLLVGINPVVRQMQAGIAVSGSTLHLWVTATTTLPFILYFAIMHSSGWQATLGKRVMRIKVTTVYNERTSFQRGVLRAVVTLIPFEVNHTIIFNIGYGNPAMVGYLIPALVFFYGLIAAYIASIFLTRRHQSLDDLVSGTVTI